MNSNTDTKLVPFTLNSYNNGFREAYTRNGIKVVVGLRTHGYDRNQAPLYFNNPMTGKETHIRSNGQMIIGHTTIFDIFEPYNNN